MSLLLNKTGHYGTFCGIRPNREDGRVDEQVVRLQKKAHAKPQRRKEKSFSLAALRLCVRLLISYILY
jgi:hypothetical protein